MPSSIQVKCLFFAASREITGHSELLLSLPQGSTTNDCLNTLLQLYPSLESILKNCVLALDLNYISIQDSLILKEGSEFAIIPPISGG